MAHVVHVLIASPSDVAAERQALREAIWEFNDEHTAATKVVLLPRTWEKNSTPRLGAPPQAILDEQIVDSSDIVIGIFWTRIGQLLDDGTHATVHELERFMEAGKPALLYFSQTPVVPDSLDPEQYAAVQSFKTRAQSWGIYRQYTGVDELVQHARRDLLAVVRDQLDLPQVTDPVAPRRGARPVARFERLDRPYLIVENRGSDDARNLTLSWVTDNIEDGLEPPIAHNAEQPISSLVGGAHVAITLLLHSHTADRVDLRIQWEDDQGPHESVQTLLF